MSWLERRWAELADRTRHRWAREALISRCPALHGDNYFCRHVTPKGAGV